MRARECEVAASANVSVESGAKINRRNFLNAPFHLPEKESLIYWSPFRSKSLICSFNLSDQRFAFFPTSTPLLSSIRQPLISALSRPVECWTSESEGLQCGSKVGQSLSQHRGRVLYTGSQQEGGLEHFKVYMLLEALSLKVDSDFF